MLEVATWLSLKMEGGPRGRECRRPVTAEKGWALDSASGPLRECRPADTLILAQSGSDLQN